MTSFPITYEERKEIEAYLKKGHTCSEIARFINRSKNGVVSEVRTNGGRLRYSAKAAEERRKKVNEERKRKISEWNKKRSPSRYTKERFENLEMQIEILTHTIKELKNAQNKKL